MIELDEHHCALFIALGKNYPKQAWKSKKQADGTQPDKYFIAGIKTPDGQAIYHLPIKYWKSCNFRVFNKAQPSDSCTAEVVLSRIRSLSRHVVDKFDAWFIYEGDKNRLYEFISAFDFDYWLKAGMDKKGYIVAILKKDDKSICGIRTRQKNALELYELLDGFNNGID